MKSIRGLIRVFAINIVIFVFAIFILELGFGDWLGANKHNRLNKLNLVRDTKVSIKGVDELYVSDSSSSFYTRDKFGFRGSYSDLSDIDILTVGGSTTDQRHVDDQLTWQSVIQNKYIESGVDVSIVNAGVDGQSTYGHLKNFDLWFSNIENLRARYILYYVGINDLWAGDDWKYDDLLRERRVSLRSLIRDKSAVYHLYKVIEGTYRAVHVWNIAHTKLNFDEWNWVRQPIQVEYNEAVRGRVAEYRERLTLLVRKTKEFGSIPIFVTQPMRLYKIDAGVLLGPDWGQEYFGQQVNGVDYYNIQRIFDSALKDIGEQHGVFTIDLASEIIPSLTNDDFYDAVHMTPAGAKKVGEFLFDSLSGSDIDLE